MTEHVPGLGEDRESTRHITYLGPRRFFEPCDELLVIRVLRVRRHLERLVEDVRAELVHLTESQQPVEAHLELGRDRRHGVGARQPVRIRGEELSQGRATDSDPTREGRLRRIRTHHRLRQPRPKYAGNLSSVHRWHPVKEHVVHKSMPLFHLVINSLYM